MEAGALIAPKPAYKDSLEEVESTKKRNPKETVKFSSIRKSNGSQCMKISQKSKKTHKVKRLAEDESDLKSSPVRKLSKISDDYPAQKSIINETEGKQPMDDPSAALGEYMLFHFPSEPGPTPKKIGLIGMGMMGQRIVKHLLNCGHDVSIWSRNTEECQKLIEAGAQLCPTPSEVARNSDIIFSDVSVLEPVKSLVFSEEGVLSGFKKCEPGTKGYVELTFCDPTTSKEIAEAINYYGGKYLEAPICDAENVRLRIMCSGDMELFKECESWFRAFSEYVSFLDSNIGEHTKYILNVNTLLSVDIDVKLFEALNMLNSELIEIIFKLF